MENASKALIIAGAVLISILLISLGILIYNQASDIVNGNQMSEVDITAFNQKFLNYEGRKNGSQVKSLLQLVRASNANEENGTRRIAINETNTSAGNDIVKTDGTDEGYTNFKITGIQNSTKYNVEFQYGDGSDGHDSGIIYEIWITKDNGSGSGNSTGP